MQSKKIIDDFCHLIGKDINIMEVCGTHTVSIFKSGIKSILPNNLKLLSGPGCPVCVTSIEDIDKAIAYSMLDDAILTTFGDMMRVPGSDMSLYEAKAEGARIEIVYSPMECLKIAEKNKDKKVIFFSAGFETTAPLTAATLVEAETRGIDNLFVFSVHKLVPPALRLLLQSGEVRIDGFILPGHVSTIIGSKPYEFIPEEFSIPCCITGFGAEDILLGITMILKQIIDNKPTVDIQYKRSVKPEGNIKAIEFMNNTFSVCDSNWRGIGVLPQSGLKLNEKWAHRDSEKVFDIKVQSKPEPKGCQCGLILRGIKTPPECPLFAKFCTPEHPVGACMVSSEGSCSAYYKYRLQ
ncbi:MAG: hydrogenase formation protein HypD [Thermodesulfovibrionales bacterium]|nr:hydrogenase formation protein HypD [Thermodesulfovibrionales bacterium]